MISGLIVAMGESARRGPVRYPDPPAFLLKREARYRSLLRRVMALTHRCGRSSYWVRHECRLRYLIAGGTP